MLLSITTDAGWVGHIVNRISLGVKLDAAKIARQETTGPLPGGDRLGIPSPDTGQHDEAGQTLPFRTQSVVDP